MKIYVNKLFLYTEIKINNKWYCINNKIKDIDKEKHELANTYII